MNNKNHNNAADGNNQSISAKRGIDSPNNARKGDRLKRLRVSRACDQCRAGREKCNGAQPTCQTCETQGRSCSYNEQPKKRGIQPNYIRTLELTLEWLLQQYPESERMLSQKLPITLEAAHQLISFKDVAAADALHQEWRNGIICRQIDQLLSGAEIERPSVAVGKQTADHDDEALTFLGDNFARPGPSFEADLRIKDDTHNHNASGALACNVGEGMLKLPENAWNLLEHYFAFTQTFLPITEKHDLLKLMYSYPEDGLRRDAATAAEHAELWSIMAWCCSQMDTNGQDFRKCRAVAQSLIPVERTCEISHAKALLLLGLIDMSTSSWAAAWWTIGSAIRILTHLIAGVPFELVSTAGRTRHTLLAAFLLESAVAAQTSAIAHLPPAMVQTLGLPIEDGIEEWSPWSDPDPHSSVASTKTPSRSISTFNELVRMALTYRSSDLSDKSRFDVLLKLLQNASASHPRENPSALLTRIKARERQSTSTPQANLHRHSSTPLQSHVRSSSFAGSWHAQNDRNVPSPMDNHIPFTSIPKDVTDSISDSTPAQRTVSVPTPDLWPGTNDALPRSINMYDFDESAGRSGSGDIFEELAMLDAAEENPKFMQNLGFGPDLDLAEFFGEDYQPSDSIFDYGQHDAQVDTFHAIGQ